MTPLETEARTFILAVLSLLELEAKDHPERRTAHLVRKGRELVKRMEAAE